MHAHRQSWTIAGSDAQPIIGDAHLPANVNANGTAIICHGFKGYKDYGMLPRLADVLAARAGVIAHRFNFSHSGMTNDLATFARPELFERDTWSRQIFDLHSVINAVSAGQLPGERAQGGPILLIGHSRGGVTCILAASRLTEAQAFSDQRPIAGIITIAAPARCNPLTSAEQAELLKQGWIESPSSRTQQRLRIGKAFIQEQLDDPAGHDLLAHAGRLTCPMLVIHGDADATVPVDDAQRIAAASGDRARIQVVMNADHVFNTPNPLPAEAAPSPQLAAAIDAMCAFAIRALKGQ